MTNNFIIGENYALAQHSNCQLNFAANNTAIWQPSSDKPTDTIILPGIIDLNAWLCEPGYTQHATINSESKAALANGITSIACQPDTSPVIDNSSVVELVTRKGADANAAKIIPIAAFTQQLKGEKPTSMRSLYDSGAAAFSQMHYPMKNHNALMNSLKIAKNDDVLVMMQPSDASLSAQGVAHNGHFALRRGLVGIPRIAETIQLRAVLTLAEHTRARIHISCVSTKDSVALIAKAKHRGVHVTCDVSIMQLLFEDNHIGPFDPTFKVLPPLRVVKDRNALLEGVRNGTIDAIVSQHRPYNAQYKHLPFDMAAFGCSAFDGMIHGLNTLVATQQLHWQHIAQATSFRPAQILGIEHQCNNDWFVFKPNMPRGYPWQSNGKSSPWFVQEKPLIGNIACVVKDGILRVSNSKE